jgi:toxin ParE1/3/4
MPGKNLPCGLSADAENDLEEIFDYTLTEFGLDQAVYYTNSLAELIESLPQNPKIGKERHEIREELFSILHGKHIIFYRILPNRIWIIRILHGNRDIPNYFL